MHASEWIQDQICVVLSCEEKERCVTQQSRTCKPARLTPVLPVEKRLHGRPGLQADTSRSAVAQPGVRPPSRHRYKGPIELPITCN